MRSELPLKTLDEAYETKDAVAVAVRTSLQTDMKWYGYEVLNALVTDLQPNQKVVDAMNQINAERRLRLAAEEKAEGQKVLAIKAAEVRTRQCGVVSHSQHASIHVISFCRLPWGDNLRV